MLEARAELVLPVLDILLLASLYLKIFYPCFAESITISPGFFTVTLVYFHSCFNQKKINVLLIAQKSITGKSFAKMCYRAQWNPQRYIFCRLFEIHRISPKYFLLQFLPKLI